MARHHFFSLGASGGLLPWKSFQTSLLEWLKLDFQTVYLVYASTLLRGVIQVRFEAFSHLKKSHVKFENA